MIRSDEDYMRAALQQAEQAYRAGEVPIGAVVTYQDRIIGEGYNQTITQLDPSAHAEMLAIRAAAQAIGNYRLVGCTLYVTIEPCTMCVGLLVHSRIDCLVFGAPEPKAGAIRSASCVHEQAHFNHEFEIRSGVLAEDCSGTMSRFFRERRLRQKALKKQLCP
ncbi:tRNA adenosine(34) deaminase TadA [Reinekea blandensis]|uniref:tRNA-specific adenosine deaminase n=1 Tax=Reinekea blandensis MED297 TaxID=314283 RepID=A4BH50_9GAMM|nr:tRNA adenosine(34) deaminase TadA [Reinekea blandensis]EAR08549.1 hypothetical protein MED297_15045 [Reinekea sp. MED297] [Reinekea blandensis MED297]